MSWCHTVMSAIIVLVVSIPHIGYAQANTNNPYCTHPPPCWEPIDDPSMWMGGECCRRIEDGTEVEVDGVVGRCCGGVWYKIDQSKEDSECWEWDCTSCDYVCTDVPGPEIAADEVETVELECIWSTEPLPTLSATATDYCGNTVAVEQSPEGGGGVYGDGESATVTLTAIDECGRNSTYNVVVEFAYQCPEYEAHCMAKANLLSAFWAQARICQSAKVLWQNLEDAFGELRETPAVIGIGLQEMCDYFSIVDPGNASVIVELGVADILNRQYENITALVESLQGVCDEWSDACRDLQQAFQDYLDTFSPECISRCFIPVPALYPSCRPCGLLDSAGDNPLEIRPLGFCN
ncbi:MAG TPA: hypothetical protein PLJ99_03270 [Kiritimatiellia bacterium]|nr:hypothetical protein [Kiritimatiellia bacterium]MDD4117112.1 hypothetical protein [Kiritimatiellia bacterium]HPR68290.1 hypothetical protein [Kiritimatiellia bacterium]